MNFDPAIFVQYGILGVVLAWFMFRMERKIENHTAVINDLVRTISMDILARENIPDSIKSSATDVLQRANTRAAQSKAHQPIASIL